MKIEVIINTTSVIYNQKFIYDIKIKYFRSIGFYSYIQSSVLNISWIATDGVIVCIIYTEI